MMTVLAALAMPARADDTADNARQVAGLFLQSCLQFAGNKAGLRAWAKGNSLTAVPAQAEQLFLSGQPGVVYDATNQVGKYVLISWDAAACATIAEGADGQAVVSSLEQDMHDAQIGFKMTADRDDTEEKSLRHREYLITLRQREWRVVVSTVKDTAGGRAMLTLNPN